MAIIKMKKLSFSVYDDERDQLIKDLQKAGCVHLDSVAQPTENAEQVEESLTAPIMIDNDQLDRYLSELEDTIKFMSEHVVQPKLGLMDSLSATMPKASMKKMQDLFEKTPLDEVLNDIRFIEKDYKETESKLLSLQKERDELLAWVPSAIDFTIVNGKSEFLGGVAGSVPYIAFEKFKAKIQNHAPELVQYIEVVPAYSTPKDQYMHILYLKSQEDEVIDLLRDAGFTIIHISHRSGTISEVLHLLNLDIGEVKAHRYFNHMLVVDYLEYLPALKMIYDYLLIRKSKAEAEMLGVKTESVSFYAGWFPAREAELIEKVFSKYEAVDYTVTDPTVEERENVPVLLETHGFNSSFEGLTNMYGKPLYGASKDPTPFMAPFYALFYGFCLSDFFYGLIMFVLFGIFARKSRNNPGTSNFLRMLSISGLSAMVFGVIFGSFFGDLFKESYLYVPFIAQIGWLDTIKKPMIVLYIALILGSVQLYFGVILNMITKMKDGVVDAIGDNLPWLVFLGGFFGWGVFVWMAGLAQVPVAPKPVEQVFYYLMMIGAGLILLNAARNGAKKGFGGAIAGFFGGLYELYGATGYLSDLLSYARLLALGLSTGVIAGVFNFLAFDMVLGDAPGVGKIAVAVVLLIFGHVFNLVISAFGAFVHSLRLQFVEFFSKFVESGGKDYEPLREAGVYHHIEAEEAK